MTERGAGEELAVTDLNTSRPSEAVPGLDAIARFGPELAQFTVVMFWASTFVVAKAAFSEVSPLAFLFARFVIMVALAFAVLLVLQRGAGRWVDRSDWGLFVLAGLSGYTLYQLGFILGLTSVGSERPVQRSHRPHGSAVPATTSGSSSCRRRKSIRQSGVEA